jgi:hypothetical protein
VAWKLFSVWWQGLNLPVIHTWRSNVCTIRILRQARNAMFHPLLQKQRTSKFVQIELGKHSTL